MSIQKEQVVPVGFYSSQTTGEYACWYDGQGPQGQQRQAKGENMQQGQSCLSGVKDKLLQILADTF